MTPVLTLGKATPEMTPDERELLLYLCSRIQEEKDPIAFDGPVRELRDLLESLERPKANPRTNDGGG